MGIGFSDWLRRVRVEQAKRILQTQRLRITDVAMAVGYRDITTFERHFKTCEKLTPVQYRKRQELKSLHEKPQ